MSKRSQHDRRRNRAGMAELNQSLIVWSSNGDQVVKIRDKRTLRIIPATVNLQWAVERLDHLWFMHIVTAGIEPSGKINFAVYVIEPDEPHNHRNCVHTFNNIHQQKLDMINPKFGRGAMWIAALEEIDFSDEQLLAMWE